MELPQSCQFGARGRKATHDFLSLYAHSPLQQDPRPTTATATATAAAAHGDFLKTHNFLQPLEREEKTRSEEEDLVDINIEKTPPSVDPPHLVEHTLPGGIGTYSIDHISYFNPKPDGSPVFAMARAISNDQNDDNSNCSSYTGSGFTLWDESAARKGNTGKENFADANAVKENIVISQWPLDGPSESSSNHQSSRRSSSQPPMQKNQSFIEMIKSAKGTQAKKEHDDENFTFTNEGSSSQKGRLRVKTDGKCGDQKASTPRSKHSATEQRRRCKINDRFQTLRELIPNSDQKRDKASFLLEVIEYIQFLQEKVHKYEGSYPGWSSEAAKLSPWINDLRPTEGFVEQHRRANGLTGPVLMFGPKLDEKNNVISANISVNPQTVVEPNNGPTLKAMGQLVRLTDKATSVATASQVEILNPMRNGLAVAHPATKPTSNTENTSLPQFQSWQNRTCASESVIASDRLKEHELVVGGGSINISSSYSQGLLNTLTHALQSSGVDLTQASISVQVDVGKRANTGQNVEQMTYKDAELCGSDKPMVRARVENNREESDQVVKKFKTGKS